VLFLRYWLPLILWAVVILSASSGGFSSENSGRWLRLFFAGDVPDLVHFAIRKAAHVVEYAILAALGWRALRRTGSATRSAATVAAGALGIALAVAVTDETLQSLSPLRTGSVWDVVLDLSGALLAVGIAAAVSQRRKET
jgi:VanZ family protein